MPSFRSVNEILDFAIAKEIAAHEFYQRLAQRVTQPQLRRVIEGFAVDELQHSIRLQAIRAGETTFLEGPIGNLGLADQIGEVEPRPDMSYQEFLSVAMTDEKAAFRLYSNLASIAKAPSLEQ